MNTFIRFDENVSVRLNKLISDSNLNHMFWRYSAEYLTYCIPFFFVYVWFYYPKLREVSVRSAVVGIVGWQIIAPLIAKLWFRERPVDMSILGEKEVLFKRPSYSFPSDHAIFLFSVATGFYMAGYKRLGIAFYIVALIITLSRVVVGVHFIGDIIVGACIGIAIGWLAWHYRDALDPIIIKPFIVIAKWIKLY